MTPFAKMQPPGTEVTQHFDETGVLIGEVAKQDSRTGSAVGPVTIEFLASSTKTEISAGPPRWLDEFMRSDAWTFMRGTAITRSPRFPMAEKTMFDTLTPSYLADLWLRGLLSRACLDDMSEAELVSMRTHTKNRTFEVRLVNDETGRHAAQRLDELTAYMRRRFPRHGSTPPCEAVCV